MKEGKEEASNDYIPFGIEWKAELKKTPKDFLIELLRTVLMINQDSTSLLSEKDKEIERLTQLMYKDCNHHSLEYEKLKREFSEYKRISESQPSSKGGYRELLEWLEACIIEANNHHDTTAFNALRGVKAKVEILSLSSKEESKARFSEEQVIDLFRLYCIYRNSDEMHEGKDPMEFDEWLKMKMNPLPPLRSKQSPKRLLWTSTQTSILFLTHLIIRKQSPRNKKGRGRRHRKY